MIDPPTTAERYTAALDSTNLRLHLDRRGDVDALIAAGWVKEGLGTALHRLRGEFDAVKAEQSRIEPVRNAHMTMLDNVWRACLADGPPPRGFLVEYELRRDQIDSTRITSLLLCRSNMGSLGQAVDRVGASAWRLADVMRLRNSIDIEQIAGRVLDVFLDPLCHRCEGRGFNGGSHRGEHQVLCKDCRSTGNRRESLGKNDTERAFAFRLLMELGSELAKVDASMRASLRRN